MSVDTHRLVCIECEAVTEEVYRLRECMWAHSPYGVRVGQNTREHCGVCPGCQASSEEERIDGVSKIGVPLERPQALLDTLNESSDADEGDADTDADADGEEEEGEDEEEEIKNVVYVSRGSTSGTTTDNMRRNFPYTYD